MMNTINIDDELREALIALMKKRAEHDFAVSSVANCKPATEEQWQAVNFHQHRMSHELTMHQAYIGLLIEQKFRELLAEWC